MFISGTLSSVHPLVYKNYFKLYFSCSSYLDLQVLSVVLGFLGGNWTLTPYVTSQVVGAEKLAEAHGILLFFGGAGLMLGPPVVGKMGSAGHTERWWIIWKTSSRNVKNQLFCPLTAATTR